MSALEPILVIASMLAVIAAIPAGVIWFYRAQAKTRLADLERVDGFERHTSDGFGQWRAYYARAGVKLCVGNDVKGPRDHRDVAIVATGLDALAARCALKVVSAGALARLSGGLGLARVDGAAAALEGKVVVFGSDVDVARALVAQRDVSEALTALAALGRFALLLHTSGTLRLELHEAERADVHAALDAMASLHRACEAYADVPPRALRSAPIPSAAPQSGAPVAVRTHKE